MPLTVMLPPSGKELPAIVRRNRRSAAKPKWMKAAFGATRVRGVRACGARGKTIVFGLFGRNGRVYAEIVPDCPKATLQGIIRSRVEPESVIHSDGRRGYDGLVDSGYPETLPGRTRRQRVCRQAFSRQRALESPWAFAKTRLARFRGIHKHMFYFHLKECEFRFNQRQEDICQNAPQNAQGTTSQLRCVCKPYNQAWFV